jgi:hypothetical protein
LKQTVLEFRHYCLQAPVAKGLNHVKDNRS